MTNWAVTVYVFVLNRHGMGVTVRMQTNLD